MKFSLKDKLRSLLHNTILLVNFFVVVLLLLSYLSSHISPQDIWILPFFGLSYPFFLVVNLGFVVYWALKRKLILLYSLIAILAGWNHLSNTFQVRFRQNQPASPENTFTFLSYNVRLFNLYEWIDDPSVKNGIYEFLLGEDPDVLCIQEYFFNKDDPYNNTRNFSRLHDRYKHIVYSSSNNRDFNFGIATFSKYPIVNSGRIEFVNSSNISIYSDVKINNDTVRVLNNHLQSVQFTQENLNFIDSLGLHKNRRNISGGIDVAYRLKEAFIRRSRQVEVIVKHIQQSPHPLIITGDFNDTPVSYTYRRLRQQGLKDAFVESGSGIGNTYVTRLPLFRIDYILHSRQLESFYFDSPRIELSDHYPQKCEFSFIKL
jgi:endonuclease/exonuclease/phosphatase family metal-dependent hydrolase